MCGFADWQRWYRRRPVSASACENRAMAAARDLQVPTDREVAADRPSVTTPRFRPLVFRRPQPKYLSAALDRPNDNLADQSTPVVIRAPS
jgi:hypothetical protein